MLTNSRTPRVVRLIRLFTRLVPAGLLLTGAGLFYTFATKPYTVRYCVAPSLSQADSSQVSLYSSSGTDNPLLVAIDCHPAKITDITFRPVLQGSYEWSFREILPSVEETKRFIPSGSSASIEDAADRHLPGGLVSWYQLQESNLQKRVRSYLAARERKLTALQRDTIEKAFAALPDRHNTSQIMFSPRIKLCAQTRLRIGLNRIEEEWERDVSSTTHSWLQRWQALTGTTLVAPISGIEGSTPFYVSVPLLKEGSGVVIGVSSPFS